MFSENPLFYTPAITQQTWEEWVDGKASRPWNTKKSIVILVITLAVLGLAAIITGLIIELR